MRLSLPQSHRIDLAKGLGWGSLATTAVGIFLASDRIIAGAEAAAGPLGLLLVHNMALLPTDGKKCARAFWGGAAISVAGAACLAFPGLKTMASSLLVASAMGQPAHPNPFRPQSPLYSIQVRHQRPQT